jgi:Resolvase, N terminal domain
MPKPIKRRVAIYARVSTQDQDPQMQLRELRSYAKHRAFTIAHEYIDHVSGATSERPELSKLWQTARARKIDTVLVWKFEQNPQSARRNNFPGEQIARRFLLLSKNLSASNYPGAAYSAPANETRSDVAWCYDCTRHAYCSSH